MCRLLPKSSSGLSQSQAQTEMHRHVIQCLCAPSSILLPFDQRRSNARLRSGCATANTTESLSTRSASLLKSSAAAYTHRSVGSRSALLLLSPSVVPPSVFPVSTRSTVSTISTGSSSHTGSSLGSSRLHVGLGNNFARQVEVLSEVGQTLVGERVVVPLPRELGLDESLGGEGLHELDDFEIGDIGDVGVSGSVVVLGSDKDTLLEEVLVDLGACMSCRAKLWTG